MQERSDVQLFCSVQESNLRHAGRLRALRARLTDGDLSESAAAVRSFWEAMQPPSPDDARPGIEGFDVPPHAAKAFVELVGEHPTFGGDERPRAGLPVIGPMPDASDPLLHERRGELTDLVFLGALALGMSEGPDDRFGETVVDIGVGADAFSGLLREVLLGKPIPDLGDLHLPPSDLIDMIEDIRRRTCGLGLAHAVTEWGRAAASNRMEAWADGIASLSPASGCAGTQVTITGSGFGAAQPSGVEVWFARTGGGCTGATQVLSWSDTQIVVVAPANVGSGCVGFVRPPAAAQPMAEAAANLAGQMIECIGPAAMQAARRFETKGVLPILKCPPCLSGNVNYFGGGPPKIERFNANGGSEATIAPGDKLDLSWSVVNATSVDVVRVVVPNEANEHPGVTGSLNATTGVYSFPSVPGTFTWDREYELRAGNACTAPAAPVTRRVTVRMRSVPDLSVAGIEATQAIQFFAANIHMLNPNARRPDNDVSLLAGKPTAVRLFVDSGQIPSFEAGTVPGVRARLHGRDSSGNPLPGSPLAPLNASFSPNPNYTIAARRRALVPTVVADERMLPSNRSFLFLLPTSWTAFGRIDVTAQVLMPAGVPERSTSNNALTQTLVFNRGGLPLRLAVLRVSYNDPVTGATIPAPSPLQVLVETDRVQRVYPSSRSLLSVVPVPGTNPWFYPGNLAAPGISCGAGFNEVVAELMIRAFFTLGMEDRVWVALLDGTALAPGQTIPASGCGAPMSSLAAAYLSGAILAGILLGPIPALVLARLGVCAVGMAAALITTPPGGVPPGPVGTLEQEIGHAFARFHVSGAGAPPFFEANWPNYQAGAPFQSIGEFGLEIDEFRGFPPALRAYSPRTFPTWPVATVDFMSYAGPPDWVSPAIYERLMTGATAPGVQPPAPSPAPFHAADTGHDRSNEEEHAHRGEITDPEELGEVDPIDVALVRGSVLHEGARLFPVYVHRRAIRLRPVGADETPYRVELRDEREQVLAGNGVLPLAEQHAREVQPDFLFGIALPWEDRTARIVLLRGGEELAAITVPAEAPRLDRPRVERSDEGLVVTWEVEAPEEAAPQYMVRFALGEERQWQMVASDLADARLVIPPGTLGGGGEARIQVGASAGGRTVWEESDPFEAEPSTPEVVIVAPSDGATVPAGEEISFRGEAMTLEAGLLDDEALSWRSSMDRALGSGRHLRAVLSAGDHTIELVATSPLGPIADAAVRVVATEAPPAAEAPHGAD
jgi:hypothetical protein